LVELFPWWCFFGGVMTDDFDVSHDWCVDCDWRLWCIWWL
jgi:hypothetical protein